MKYEVIGWIYCGNRDYPSKENISASVNKAIINEIRKHGYLFGGDMHENYCPVLNDGTYVGYSWREWGKIIASAYEEEGGYSYMSGYMDEMIYEKSRKYPESLPVADVRIVPREAIAETFVISLEDESFDKIRNGTKTVEVRLSDELFDNIEKDDYIEFRKKSDESRIVIRRVAEEPLVKDTFKEIFLGDGEPLDGGKFESALRFTPRFLGAPENVTVQSLVDGMYKHYDRNQEKQYGAVAFVLEEPKPFCQTCLKVLTDGDEWLKRYMKKLEVSSDKEFKLMIEEELCERETIESAIKEIADFTEAADHFYYGKNNEYNVDVNVMIRKTLARLFGKEDRLKFIQERHCAVLQLEIFSLIVRDSEQPNQLLSLDKDIVEFLHKSGTQLKFDYKVI